MAGYAAGVNEYCGRTLFLHAARARDMPCAVNKRHAEKRHADHIAKCLASSGQTLAFFYGNSLG